MRFCYLTVWCSYLLLLSVLEANKSNKTEIRNKNITTYSAPLTKHSVRKIYIHGRPVYVREMFASPIRARSGFRRRFRDDYSGQHSPIAPVSTYKEDGYENSVTSPPIPAQEPIYAPASQPNVGPGGAVSKFDEETYNPKNAKYPLPECYTNDSGFMCCNKELEKVMDDAFDKLKGKRNADWHSCNVQLIANEIQKATESNFNLTFEVVTGIGDYASKSHFFHNYICKMERDNRFILAYATPKSELGYSQPTGLSSPGNLNNLPTSNDVGNVFGPPTQYQQNKPPYAHSWKM